MNHELEKEILDAIDELFSDDMKDHISGKDVYEYEGRKLPRVTNVIRTCNPGMNKLLEWSNSLGFNRIDYKGYMKRVSSIGTACHTAVENYILNKEEPKFNENDFANPELRAAVTNAFEGFKAYWDRFTVTHKIKNVYVELHIRTPWYAGTCDLIIEEADGAVTLCDFKSSSKIKDEHFIQLAAYKYGLEYPSIAPLIKVDKVCILKLNKYQPVCNEYLLDLGIFQNQMFINHCKDCFFSMLYTYYNYNIVRDEFKSIVPKKGV